MTADFPTPKALVFDMDGLLLDTEKIARDGFMAACRSVGVEPDPDVYLRTIGTRSPNTRRILVEGHGEDFPIDAVVEAWNERFRQREANGEPLPVKPGAAAILEAAAELELPCALVTSSSDPGAGERMHRVGLLHRFALRITGDKVANPKPHPEPFLKAAAGLGMEPAHCWAFEDSPNGIRSAAGAGMKVFQIPDLIPPDQALTRRLGVRVLPDLHVAQRHLKATFQK